MGKEVCTMRTLYTLLYYVQCPHCIILPDPDPYDWFCDDDVKLFCEKLKRTVAAALRPHEGDKVDIPSDCPLE